MVDFIRRVPEGDNRERAICAGCGYVAYENPKIIVGSVVVAEDDKVLLCRRAIEPRLGFWTLPAGFMELGETLEEGARREALEEAQARIHIEGIIGVFSISRIGQVQVLFRARFSEIALAEQPVTPLFGVGEESLEVGLFEWDSIPWEDLAFPTVKWALEAWKQMPVGPIGAPAGNPPEDPRGVSRPPSGALMRCAFALLVLAPCMVGLAHSESVRKAEPAPSSEILPLPPVPPFNRPAYEAAPLPNSEARAPQELVPQGIELVPRLYRRPETQTGLGYTPGSAFREPDSDRLNKLGPGFNLKVPIN